MRVIVSVFNNLVTDQRVEKVCRTLHEAGHEIILIGNDWAGAPPLERPYKILRIRIKSKKLKFAYAEFNLKLFREIVRFKSPGCVLLANDLDTLPANDLASKLFKIPLVFDSHEIFTEQPSVQGRFSQKIWRFLEKAIVPGLNYMMTESASYAGWFRAKYGISPVVVRNIPRRIPGRIDFIENSPKIIIWQGALNESRGLFQAISAMKYLDNAILKIAGDGNLRADYEKHTRKEGLGTKVEFLGRLSPEKLRKFTKIADAGLAVEENNGLSYYYSLPNKVPDYIQSLVPAVLINFPEIKKIFDRYKIGEMIDNHNPETIAAALKTILENGREFYADALREAAREYCWEMEEEKILELFRKAEMLSNA